MCNWTWIVVTAHKGLILSYIIVCQFLAIFFKTHPGGGKIKSNWVNKKKVIKLKRHDGGVFLKINYVEIYSYLNETCL